MLSAHFAPLLALILVSYCIKMTNTLRSFSGKPLPKTGSFWEKLGSPRHISAPMVDHSYLPWRLLVRNHGTDLAVTQMINAGSFVKSKTMQADVMDWLDHSCHSTAAALDTPIIAQLAGNNTDILVKAGRILQANGVDVIDLNLGCPQGIARRGNYGAYLLPDQPLVTSILSTLVSKLDIPITAKIRRLPGPDEETLSLCAALQGTGISMLTVHGRTVKASKNLVGPVDWDIIRKIKQTLSIPVIANGGISCWQDVQQCLAVTGADAVMSSEALLENPALFNQEGDERFRNAFPSAQIAMVGEFLDWTERCAPGKHITFVRSHLFKMLHRFLQAPMNVDLRNRLSKCPFGEMRGLLQEIDRRVGMEDYDPVRCLQKGLLSEETWYMRHRAEGRIISLPKELRNAQPLRSVQDLKDKIRRRTATATMHEQVKTASHQILQSDAPITLSSAVQSL